MANILDFVKQKYSEALQKLGAVEHQVSYTGSKYIDQAKTQLSQDTSKAQQIIAQAFDNAKNTIGIPNSWNAPINPNSLLGKFGQGVMAADNFLTTAPVISDIGYKIPQEYGTQAGNLIGTGLQQTVNGRPSNIPFTKIPVSGHIAGPAKVGLGLLGLTPGAIPGDYAMSAAESAATPVFGKDSLATLGIGLAAGLVAPTSLTGEAGKAENFLSKLDEAGQKGLQALPKEERLSWLVNYQGELQKMGYKLQDIQKISAPRAKAIIDNNISPALWATRAQNVSKEAPKVENVFQKAQNAFNDWVNSRAATQVEGFAKRQDFQDLNNQGLKGILDFQGGAKSGRLQDVQNYFDTKYAQLQKEGQKFGYKADYLPQIWENSKAEVERVMGKTLTQKPSFTMQSLIKDYETGMSLGLTPKYKTIGELAQYYEQTANKSIADRKFFNFLSDSKFILPDTKAPSDWVQLDSEKFPKFVTKTATGSYSGNYKAPKELADAINNYLSEPTGSFHTLADVNTALKNIYLSSGFPKTGWNFHGVNILARNTLATNNPIKGFLTGVYYLTRPSEAQKFIDSNLGDLTYAVKHGLTASSEDHRLVQAADEATSVIAKGYNKVRDFHQNVFDKPLFSQVIPALKIKYWKATFNDLQKSLPEEQAAAKAAEITNNMFGGQNLDILLRSKQTQDMFRNLILAPDWSESNLKVGAGIVKSLANPSSPELKAYRIFARNYILSYLTLNITNKYLSGHFAFQNAPGHQFELEAGYSANGQKRYIQPYGTSTDFIRLPVDFSAGVASGDSSVPFRIIRNRLSPLAGQFVGQVTNTNYAGQPIAQKDSSLGQQLLARGGEAAGTFTPSYISNPIRYITGSGNMGAEQLAAQTLELPIRYQGGAYNNLQKTVTQQMQQNGASGEDIYNVNQSLKGASMPQGVQAPSTGLWDKLLGKKQQSTQEPTDPFFKYMKQEQDKSLKDKVIKEILTKAPDRATAEKQLKAAGYNTTFDEAAVGVVKSMGVDDGTRPGYIRETLKGLNNADFLNKVQYFAENKILTSSVVDYWSENGDITDQQATTLKNLIKKATGKSVSTGFKKPTFPSLKYSVPKRTPIKIAPLPKLQDYNSWKTVQPHL